MHYDHIDNILRNQTDNISIIDNQMDANLFNQAVVVLAKQNNPSILNPDFLRIQSIVPDDWIVKGHPITTPPFSQVAYENGCTITVEENKIQVSQDGDNLEVDALPLSEITKKYLATLPHVNYYALGINFRLAVTKDNTETYIIERFLNDGPWNSHQHPLVAAGVKLVYPFDGGKFTLTVDPGKHKVSDEKIIVFHANFHRDIADTNTAPFDSVKTCYEQFSELTKEILSK